MNPFSRQSIEPVGRLAGVYLNSNIQCLGPQRRTMPTEVSPSQGCGATLSAFLNEAFIPLEDVFD